MKTLAAVLILAVSAVCGTAEAGAVWRLDLADTAVVHGATATLKDVARGPVPAGAAALVLHAGGRPGTAVRLSRQGVLRRLVDAGLAGGVRLSGAQDCVVVYEGEDISSEALTAEMRRQVQALVPASEAGAPAPWFELELPALDLAARGDWSVSLETRGLLEPGRNLLRARVTDGHHRRTLPVTVILHQYGETAEFARDASRGDAVTEDHLRWTWTDLAGVDAGLAVGRASVQGRSAARSLRVGDPLRRADLKETPLVLAGDPVELRIVRGGVAVSVRAHARQDGCEGQTIPVRNELTGRLVNARVAAPGLVEWRR